MGRKNRKGRTRNMGRGKQIRTTLANDILIRQNAAEETQQDVNPQDSEQIGTVDTARTNADCKDGVPDQTIEVISLDKLFLADYQRILRPGVVENIVNDFNPAQLGVLMVSKRPDGTYAVIDGQHRMTALRRLGYKFARCSVVQGWTEQDEARNFSHQRDNTTNLTAKDRFKSGVIGGEEDNMKINYILTKHGYHVVAGGRGTRVEAVSTLSKIAKIYSYEVLDRVLELTKNTLPGEKKAVCREMLVALSELVSRFEISNADAQARLGRSTPESLIISIRKAISSDGYVRNMFGKQERFCSCRVLVDAYNRGLGSTSKKRLRLTWDERMADE